MVYSWRGMRGLDSVVIKARAWGIVAWWISPGGRDLCQGSSWPVESRQRQHRGGGGGEGLDAMGRRGKIWPSSYNHPTISN